jgi:DNA-binding NarL/FixJ family response regulator
MSPEAALASSRARAALDVTSSAKAVAVPTLVLHADGDRAVPFEQGRRVAGLIPDARFVPLHSTNHILLSDEAAWPEFLAEVTDFAAGARPSAGTAVLTDRELELLHLVADGCGNADIGLRLSLSTRTVERHLSNIYTKLGLSGKSARAAAAAQLPDLERRSTPG